MNENISAKDLLNLILGNQETPTITENKEMDLNEAISYFLNNQIKNSIETLKYYKIEFNCLRPYFKMYNIKSTKDLNNDFVNKLITIKKNEGVKNITINKMLGTIKIMLNFLIKENLITESHITISNIKFKQAKITIPTKEELLKFKNYIDTKASLKYQVIFYILIDTGLRRSSIANLLISDIDLNEQSIIPSHTKENNEIKVYFGNKTKSLISKFIETNKKLKSKYLFPSQNPLKPIPPTTITKNFSKIRDRLGITSISPHRLRHYFGTNLIKNNVNPEIVRKLLGHSSLRMTQRYIDLNDEDLKSVSINCSIADNIEGN